MRFRQIEQLLDGVTQADTTPVSATEGNQGLGQLVTAVELVFPGIEIADNPFQTVRLGNDQNGTQDHQRADQGHEPAQPDTAQENHPRRCRHQHHSGTEVRLNNQQNRCQTEDDQRLQETRPGIEQFIPATDHVAGQVGNQAEFRHFRDLDVEQAEWNPAGGAVHGTAQGRQHENQDQQTDAQQQPAAALPPGHRHVHRYQGQQATKTGKHQLTDHIVVAVTHGFGSHIHGRRGNHDHTHHQQCHGADHQHRQGLYLAQPRVPVLEWKICVHHRASTRERNWSPRSR